MIEGFIIIIIFPAGCTATKESRKGKKKRKKEGSIASSVSSAWPIQLIILVPDKSGPRASPLRIGWGFDKNHEN